MALVLEIVLGVMILASFFVAYMSARTWQIYQVVLVVFVFLSSVGFFYLAARTLATHKAWRNAVQQRQSELATLEKQSQDIFEGGAEDANGQRAKGIRQLKQELQTLAMDRGGVLYDVAVDGIKEGVVQLTLKSPDHGLVAKSVVFAFDQATNEEGGRYQGEFKVVSVGEGEGVTAVQVAPNVPLTDAEAQRLAASKGPWTLYTTMPIDDLAVFAKLDDKIKQSLLPQESLPEYAAAERKLRDYEFLFHENYIQRSLLADAISKITSNIERTTAATAEATREIEYREGEKTNLKADLTQFQHELTAIAGYQKTLEKLFQHVRESLKAKYAANKQLAADLTAVQLKAAQEINDRSRASAADASLSVPALKPVESN